MTGIDPSRLAIHTALNGNWTVNGVQGQSNYLNTTVPTVTALLKAAGYRTGHFGKWCAVGPPSSGSLRLYHG